MSDSNLTLMGAISPSANLSKLNTPPSLILSPSSTESPSETTPSALNPNWKRQGTDKLFEEINPTESASTVSSRSNLDESAILSRGNSAHSRGSSTTSTTSAVQKPEHNSRAFGNPLGPDNGIGPLSSERPHSFSGGLSQSDLRRLQNLPTKGQPPSPISTLERLDGPRTSPPRENVNEIWGDRLASAGPTNSAPRFPTLGEQPTAFPSIQGQGDAVLSPVHHQHNMTSPTALRGEPQGIHNDLQDRLQLGKNNLYAPARAEHGQPRNPPIPRQAIHQGYQLTQQQQQDILQQSAYMYPTQGRPAPLDRPLPGYAPQSYYEIVSPPPMRREQQMLNQRVPPSPHFNAGHHNVGGDHPTLRNTLSMSMLNGGQGLGPYVGMPAPANGMYTTSPNSASPLGGSFPGFAPNTPSFYPQTATYSNPDALSNAMGRMTISSPYAGSVGSRGESESVSAQNGPSANNRKLGLYKTELCRSWEEKGTCRYGAKCQFAHSEVEVRKVSRHPKVCVYHI